MRSVWPIRLLTWAGAFVAGAVYGIAGTVMHSASVIPTGLAGLIVPLGTILAAVGLLALLVAVRCLSEGRGTVLAAGLGALAMLLVFSGEGPGGSVVVPRAAPGEAPLGVIWSWVVAIVVVVVVAWPDLRGVRAGSGKGQRAGA
ncbi:histidinol dehydrogenase [Microbacterium sp. Marseille-Q6965]|uniref:histidinol dehydrogenase n=1 Tax=Microbacterium sp. Marseille-Q6965 TaxID=2965072 RepID=UPI0021B82B72|nr:histidinol dehydrogenase [Microbacterium sp. Marseille-Q6965]